MNMNVKWICPAVTPLHSDGSLDLESTERLYDHLTKAGMGGVLVSGSLGEFFALPLADRAQAARFAVERLKGKMRVLVGTACTDIEETIHFSNTVLENGADAVMIVPPYYFTLGDQEVFNYFERIAKNVTGPIYIYNFPDRTGYSISPLVIKHLAEEYPQIVGVKDTVSSMAHTRDVINMIKPIRPDFEVFSGFDDNFAHNVLSGGDGCIGGLSNIAPQLCSEWVQAVKEQNLSFIAQYQQKINRCMCIYNIGSPFVPYVKEACRQVGYIASSMATYPIGGLREEEKQKVTDFLHLEGIL